MRTTAPVFGFTPAGMSRQIALALLVAAALSAGLSGCGAGTEALPSDLPPPAGGGALIITTTTMEDGVINRSYSKTLDTTGGTPPLISCTISAGALPPGLTVAPSGSTCVVSGTPTMAGTFMFTVRAEDSNNISDTQDYTLVIRNEFTITGMAPDPLPDGVEDAAYNFMFTVTTNTVTGPSDTGQVFENGNGPITMCTLGGLPAGMMAVGGTFTSNSCQVTVSGTPNIGLAPMSAPMTFMLTLSVTDTAIGGSSTPPGTVTQTAIDLTIQPPVAITLITTDVASTAGCTGGTFDDSTGGGAAPDGVNGRTYGDPQCDLLFMATGGIIPYTWTDNSAMPPAPFGCAQEGANNEFFRCNSGMAALTTAGGTATDVTVEVMDAGNMASSPVTQGTDINGHASHSIFVNDAVAVASDLGNPLPDAVMDQPYGEAPGVPATFTASGGLGAVTGYTFSTTTGLAAPGAGFPDTIGCNQTAPDTNACATNMSTITAAVGLYTPTMQADDLANDTTPSGSGMVTVDLSVLAPLTFTLITADAATTTACSGGTFDDSTAGGNAPDAATGRTYGDPECDLLFTASGARAPYTWNTNSAAPAPIACTQEGTNGEFFRCNSGGNPVTATMAATLGVDVTDTANVAVPAITQDTDVQGHMGHLINIAPDIVLNLITTDPASFAGCTGGTFTDTTGNVPTGVFGRTYGNPQCDLLFRASGGIPDATNGYSWPVIGAPLELSCAEETELVMDDRLRCNTMGAGFSGVGLFVFGAAVEDGGNDTTPSFIQTTDDQGHTDGSQAAHNLAINNEIGVVSDQGNPLPDAVMGQPYGEAPDSPVTFTASNGLGMETGYVFSTTTGLTMPGAGFPDTIGCGQFVGGVFSCATNMSTITAATGTYMPTVDADDTANDTTPDSVTAGTTASVTVDLDVVAAMMFTLVTADPAMTACAGGTFTDTTGDAPDAVTGRTYGDPECDLLFQVTGGRAPYTWNTNSAAPAPIACAQEGADNEFFRCNSGGGGVAGGTSTLGVDVTDTGSSTLGALNVFIDDQGHGGHMINVRDEFAGLTFTPAGAGGAPQMGVTGRPYGTPTGSQDLVISFPVNTGIGPVTMTPDENTTAGQSAAQGFPNDLDCVQTIDRQIECTTGAGVITDPAGVYMPVVTGDDTGNDTTPAGGFGTSFNLVIVDEITINNLFLANGVVGQPYTQTLTCDPGTGFCGGTGNPNVIDAVYTWGETNTAGLCPPDAPANPDITVSTTVASNPSTGAYSGTPTAANAGTFAPGICVTDNGNDVTPSCNDAGTCPLFSPTYSVFDAVAAIDASNNEVDIFDTNTNTFNAAAFGLGNNVTLDVMSTPFKAAFSPNGSVLVVVDPGESEVDIIDVATGGITSVTGLTSGAGDPTGVVIGPASNPLANPDSWVAYVANPTAGMVDVIDIDPNSGTFGTVTGSVAIAGAKDVAITPTFAGPETRVYVLSGANDVCAFDADPGSIGALIDLDPGAPTCIDASAGATIPGTTQFIEITPNGLQALVTKHDGVGSPAGMARLVRIDTDPTSGTRDTITATADLGAPVLGATGRGCFLPNDLRSDPASGFVIVACGTDVLGDQFVAFDVVALGITGFFPVAIGDDPQDVAFTISGSEAIGTLKGVSSIERIFASTTVALPNVTAPDGVDHSRDPQLNALVNASFPVQAGPNSARAGREYTTSVGATGGVQPYTWSVVETSGTACEGLNLNPVTGRISGMPVNTGTCSLTVQVTDSTPGAPQSRRVTKTITVE